MTSLPALRIDERSARRLMLGYPWVFRSEVLSVREASALAPGQIVDFVRAKGDFVARGFFNPKPQLVGRVLTRQPGQDITAAFVRRRVEVALRLREKIYPQPFYRLIHAESDGLPGLVADRYGDVVVAQVNTAGMEALWPQLQAALQDLLRPQALVLRNDTPARELEGLEQSVRVAQGALPVGGVRISENSVDFLVDVQEGQKTGWFFDQRDNRAWVAGLARGGSLLDVFCHTGGFGVTAGKNGAKGVTFVDSSGPALRVAEENARLNGIADRCQMIEGKAFETLEKLAGEGKSYDVVALDPPAFIKSRKDMAAGLRGYLKLARLAAPLVKKNGFLFLASCSHHAGVNELSDAATEGMARTGRDFQLVKTAGAAPDHPVHPLLPETGYLKALTFRFLD